MIRRMRRQQGEGKAGLIISLIVVAYLIFCGVRFVPVYIGTYDLEETIRRQAEAASNRTEKMIVAAILETGNEHSLPLTAEHIEIKMQKRRKVRIKVEFSVPIDFALFTYNYNFKMDLSRDLF